MHLYVNFTINRGATHRLPATILIAAIDMRIFFLILTEVQAFCRMYLAADGLNKVFVINKTVAISIELFEKVIKVCLCDLYTPMVQEKLQFLRLDRACLFTVQIHKGLP